MKKNKISIVDIILVVTVLLLIGTAVYRSIAVKRAKADVYVKPVVYTLTVPSLDAGLLECLKVGDTRFFKDGESECGTIETLEASFAKEDVTYPDGTRREHIKPDTVECTVGVRVTADHVSGNIRFENGKTLSVGETVSVYTASLSFDGFVASVAADV